MRAGPAALAVLMVLAPRCASGLVMQAGQPSSLVLAMFMALARSCAGGLVVQSGELRGLALEAVPFHFSRPRDFDVSGPLALVVESNWQRQCPCPCLPSDGDGGIAASLVGAIVLFQASSQACSAESIARALSDRGALALLSFRSSDAMAGAVPGLLSHAFLAHDSREYDLPAADLTQARALPLFEVLRAAGREPVIARLTPSADPWAPMRAWPLVVWSVFFVLLSAASLEIAASRLYANVRLHGRLAPTMPQLMLSLQVFLSVLRIVFLGVDPYFGRGIFSQPAGVALATLSYPIMAVASMLFLIFYLAAFSDGGLLSGRLHHHPLYKTLLVVTGFCTLLADILMSMVMFLGRADVDGARLFRIKLAVSGAATPAIFLALILFAYVSLAREKAMLPSVLCDRLQRQLNWSIVSAVVQLVLGLCFPWAILAPWRSFGVFGAAHMAQIATSILQSISFSAPGVATPRGPFERAAIACSGAFSRIRRRAHLVASRRVSPLTLPVMGKHQMSPMAQIAQRFSNRSNAQRSIGSSLPSEDGGTLDGQAPRHLLLGITSAAARATARELGMGDNACTADVGAAILKRTASLKRSMAEEIRRTTRSRDKESSHSPIGKANLFVSHAQGCSFFKMLDAVDSHIETFHLDPAKTFLWLDVFCSARLLHPLC